MNEIVIEQSSRLALMAVWLRHSIGRCGGGAWGEALALRYSMLKYWREIRTT